MAELNNLPESDDTKTRVTVKITPGTPGKTAPEIDLNEQADSSTLTRRTLKLQSLAGLSAPKASAPAAAPKPQPSEDEDTRTRRTVKLSTLASGATVKPLNINRPAPSAAPAAMPGAAAPAPTPAQDTLTRRTKKLEALDTQDVIAMTESDLTNDTRTRRTVKLADPTVAPPPQAANSPVPKTRQTVKVEGIVPAHTPVIDLDAKPGDTNTRKTVKLSAPEAGAPEIDLDATAGDDTRTRKSVKVDAPADAKFNSGNVDDTVKLQRPAPKPAMPGSVAPAAQSGAPAIGGIKLSKPIAKPAAKPVAAPAAAPVAAPAAAPVAQAPAAEPAKPEKGGLKVNTDAVKDLGTSPMAQKAPDEVSTEGNSALKVSEEESLFANITFSFFGVLAILLLILVAAVATVDYLNIWQKNPSDQKIELPLLPDMIKKASAPAAPADDMMNHGMEPEAAPAEAAPAEETEEDNGE